LTLADGTLGDIGCAMPKTTPFLHILLFQERQEKYEKNHDLLGMKVFFNLIPH